MKQVLLILLMVTFLVGAYPLHPQEEYSTDFEIAFQINQQNREATVYQGEPLILYFGLSNPKAMNALYYNLAMGQNIKEVNAITLGQAELPWTRLVSFVIENEKGEQIPSWPGTIRGDLFTEGPKAIALLDGENVAHAYFVISPEVSTVILEGTYRLKVIIDTKEYQNYPMWQGRVSSDVFLLKITARPAQLSQKELEKSYELHGTYYLLIGNFEKAKEFAEKILARDSHSLAGLNLLANALEGLGKFEDAIQVLENASHEFWQQYPRSYEPPEEIVYRIQRIKEKLEKK